MDNVQKSLLSGLAGAVALTLLHETVRRFVPEAPRADILGMRAIAKGFEAADKELPDEDTLHQMALGGDLVSNTLYYSLVGLSKGKDTLLFGSALGALAGVGALTLPGPLKLGEAPTNRTRETMAMTIAWYLLGGVVAAGTYELLDEEFA
ncbi:hypothetical protein GCM10023187_23170 [Nibrella viscosa]|uniref:Uncharacterized protein n=1 Tax=Nibrella viscosa TaxID=1084524 RepID=A0ABP8KEC6_9BACT